MSDIQIPDVAGEIVGYRAWHLTGKSRSSVALGSCVHDFVWPFGQWTYAQCNTPGCVKVGIPGENHTCGIYAAKTRQHLMSLSGQYHLGMGVVIGKVGLAGKVIPGTQGWRAEKARVVEIYVSPQDAWALPLLEKRYHCKGKVGNPQAPIARKYGVVPIQVLLSPPLSTEPMDYSLATSMKEPPATFVRTMTEYAVVDMLTKQPLVRSADRQAMVEYARKLNAQEV